MDVALQDAARGERVKPKRIFLLGSTGTIGRATVRALLERGHEVVCFVRPSASAQAMAAQDGIQWRYGDVTDPTSLVRDGFRGERFDALVSCLASRTGTPRDAWAIDHLAHVQALAAARGAGVTHMVLLSAICVQKPVLAFQHAKRAFEAVLAQSGTTYSIVRPTAYFKSLSGQIERVRRGKPFLVFGCGTLTACKPISDDDLARYLVDCLDDPTKQNRILPIGGPGDAVTPRQQGEALFRLLGRAATFQRVPVRVLDATIATLAAFGRVSSRAADAAELARIGRYYATQSMLVWDPAQARYDASATPSTGTETLDQYYARVLAGETVVDRGEHAVF